MDNNNSNQILSFLQELNRELELLRTKSLKYLWVIDINSPQIISLLELENRAPTILSLQDAIYSNLNHLKTFINNLKSYQSYTPRSFIQRRLISYQISRIGLLIQKEIQLCVDKENVSNLVKILKESCDEEEKLRALDQFESRISTGFDSELQNLIRKERLFPVFESILCDVEYPPTVQEKAGCAIAALTRFNRNVFVGYLLMGFTIPILVLDGSSRSLEILISLVKSCEGHLVNEMELSGVILDIIYLLSSEDFQVRLMAMHCLIEMAYFSTKEVLESMIDGGLVEKLVLLQRVEFRSDLSEVVIQMEDRKNIELCVGDDELGREKGESSSNNPFSGCIARFVVQVEVGEGMEKSEKKEIKMMILRRVRAACVSEAEAATVVAEILWGSHP